MATASQEAELKTQGVMEASRNPNTSVTAEDAEKKMVEEAQKAGVPSFSFDPDASPEEKAAQAKAVSTDHRQDPYFRANRSINSEFPKTSTTKENRKQLRLRPISTMAYPANTICLIQKRQRHWLLQLLPRVKMENP